MTRFLLVVLALSISCAAQTTTTEPVPLKPIPVKPAPKARKAAATKAAPATSATPATASTPSSAVNPLTTSQPAAASPSVPANNAVAPNTQSAAPAADRGTLAWATRVYSPTTCVHNGTHAMCTFTFVNQGNGATLRAFNGGEMAGISLVDDAHVPHRWDGAYFVDKYGSQQHTLFVEKGDTGTYMVSFPNVDPRVASAEFHLRNQVIGGVSVGAPPAAPSQGAAAPPPASAGKK